MASSFKGWGSSWAQTWDRVSNPNAMYGSASITITATGLLTNALPPVEPPDEGPVAMIYPRRLAKRPGLTKENEEALLLFVL